MIALRTILPCQVKMHNLALRARQCRALAIDIEGGPIGKINAQPERDGGEIGRCYFTQFNTLNYFAAKFAGKVLPMDKLKLRTGDMRYAGCMFDANRTHLLDKKIRDLGRLSCRRMVARLNTSLIVLLDTKNQYPAPHRIFGEYFL